MAFLQIVRLRPQTARGVYTFPSAVISSHRRLGVKTGLWLLVCLIAGRFDEMVRCFLPVLLYIL